MLLCITVQVIIPVHNHSTYITGIEEDTKLMDKVLANEKNINV
jgi:hypothetical protein